MRILAALLASAFITVGALALELSVWRDAVARWPKYCPSPAVPELPSALMVWSGVSLALIGLARARGHL